MEQLYDDVIQHSDPYTLHAMTNTLIMSTLVNMVKRINIEHMYILSFDYYKIIFLRVEAYTYFLNDAKIWETTFLSGKKLHIHKVKRI